MGKFTGILLVSDYDGTFTSLRSENYRKNINAVLRFKDGGGIFTFATGRDYHSLYAIEPDFESIANAPVVMANGARLYDADKKEYIFNQTLNAALLTEFLAPVLKKYPDTGVRFSCEEGLVTPDYNEILKYDLSDIFMKDMPLREMPVQDMIDSGEKIYKCVIVHNPETIYYVREMAKEFNNSRDEGKREICFTQTYSRGLEAVNINASKGMTALKLKEYLNKRDNALYKFFAIGDYDNDVDMLKSADLGAAPSNALDHVKEIAKVHTVSCKEGAVADFIRIIESEYL